MDEEDFYKPRAKLSRSAWDAYAFAWHPNNMRTLLLLFADMTMLALIACGFATLHNLVASMGPEEAMSSGGTFVLVGSKRVFGSLCVLAVLGSVYVAGCFVHVIQDTAAGAREVDWSNGAWIEFLGGFLRLLWVAACCAIVAAILLLPLTLAFGIPKLVFILLQSIILLFIFPPVLLSTMAGGAAYVLIEPRLMGRIVQRPQVLLSVYLNSFLFYVPCVGLGYWMLSDVHWWLTPVVGYTWAIFWLTYARVLGRAAWQLSDDEPKPRRKRRRQAVAVEDDAD
jgi:hypothetical protein